MVPTHQLERTPDGWYCPVCRWSWPRGPRGACPGVPRYAPDAIPTQLQTKPQLRAAGLQPGGPAQGGYYASGETHWRWLYAVDEAVPVPPAPAPYPSQQKWTWAVQQIMRVAQQARDPED